jgi:hypothetical protein
LVPFVSPSIRQMHGLEWLDEAKKVKEMLYFLRKTLFKVSISHCQVECQTASGSISSVGVWKIEEFASVAFMAIGSETRSVAGFCLSACS